jgi:DNA topoisomerase IA
MVKTRDGCLSCTIGSCLFRSCSNQEGENIAHEVIAIARRAILSNSAGDTNRIHRAQFSAITPSAIQDAFANLKVPDADLSRSVDARQELDLRVGVVLTRLLTWKCVTVARTKFSPSTRMM